MSIVKDSIVECEIESLAYGGRGVAKVDGMAVFVAGGLPGDTVSARILKAKKRFAEAVAESIVEPSKLRVEPVCQHFGVCGGCAVQDLDYAEQLAQKGAQVASALSRIGGVENLKMDAPVPSPDIWRYRNKMEFAFEHRDAELHLGLRATLPRGEKGLGPVIDIEECHLCASRDVAIMHSVRDFCRESNVVAYHPQTDTGFWRHLVLRHTSIGQVQVHLITTADERKYNLPEELSEVLMDRFPEVVSFVHSIRRKRSTIAFGEEIIYRLGHKFVEEHLPKGDGSVRYHLAPNTFFQTNSGGASELFATISEFGGFTGHETVLDLYCGAGAIGIYLANEVGRVIGYEVNEEAIGKAWASAKLNHINNCEFHAVSLNGGIENVDALPTPDVIVVDPPRSGMQEKTAYSILRLAPAKIVAVACDPTTLARDVKRLSSKYTLTRARAVDMFPHTHHVETVALLERK
ncbi:23S rRNA (uracil(1939)-C(5))-methyltransferase RlmD [Pseudodesulfovibrio piezophilus]|uniref:RNA methyltransferase, TrmA family n=1 Tax=Pseudodesulfovibrio piezophilus (strain DSM 21447 / JCM 15486 / C1TLV30) TaxID=1322246 RepID=M1WVY9_PSEP2|nr:23S rRNA (uracil(1939)-C(5))-methyltransferase RlmD [Pseudodesulfovibrio piezophilus]CCH48818.1 RNA methyltransferase, TrmA family [Pseudodesulfovibrio piezophilus C1TLV30]